MTALAPRQKILIPLIILSFTYILWQLYEEYSLIVIEPSLSTNLLLASTEKLRRSLAEQEANLNVLEKEIERANESVSTLTIDSEELISGELFSFIENYSKKNEILQTSINWETIPPPIKKNSQQQKPTQSLSIEKQLLAIPKQFYTLQLMGAYKKQMLLDLIAKNQLQGKVKLLRVSYRNKDWYVLLYGTYKNYRSAKLAEKVLPKSLQQLQIWIRPMSSVHEAIKKTPR